MSERDIKLMGEGSVSGGTYGQVKVFGDGHFLARVTAEEIKIFGSAQVQEVEVKLLKVMGSARLEGRVVGGEIKITGSVQAYQAIKAETLAVRGELSAKHEVQAEQFVSHGSLDLTNLNANDVEIRPSGHCRIREIGAENITVSRKALNHKLGVALLGRRMSLFGHFSDRLVAESIEADRIYLEDTEAKTVRGNVVKIGPGCVIELVEYKDTVWVDKSSTVSKTVQI